MKKLFLSALGLLAIGTANAQLRYTVSTQTGQTYTPLTTGSTNLSATVQWDEDDFTAPIGFTFQLAGRPITDAFIRTRKQMTVIGNKSTGNFDTLTGISPLNADIWDRGGAVIGTTKRSPIRYVTTGTSPSRIFKLEFFNAGFYTNSTNTDSTNFQVWMYEGSNVLEVRYGASRVTTANFNTYFSNSSGPRVGFASNVYRYIDDIGKFYYLRGSATAPTVDSVMLPATPAAALAAYPANGTVYRFSPGGTTGVALTEAVAAARALQLYPTVATDALVAVWWGKAGEAYEVVSANGQRVAAGTLQPGTQRIVVSGLAAGNYFVKLAGASHQFVKQ